MKVIITGASGMVGEGVLLECLKNPYVSNVLVIGRKSCGHTHAKLREILHQDFLNLAPIEKELAGYDACFFCLGVSSVGMSKEAYKRMTYDLTLEMANRLKPLNPDLTFCYVTGMHTDAKSGQNWAQVKAATENELLRVFKNGYMFRPGAMYSSPGQKNLKRGFKTFESILFPVLKIIFRGSFCRLEEVGRAMIACAKHRPNNHILEVADIKSVAESLT